MQRSIPVPAFFNESDGFYEEGLKNPIDRLTQLTIQIPELRQKANDLSSKPPIEASFEEILALRQKCRELAAILANWRDTRMMLCYPLQPMYVHTGIDDDTLRTHTILWSRRADHYHDLWVAAIWALYRANEITLHDIICRCAPLLEGRLPGEELQNEILAHSVSRLQVMADEVCASIPYHLTYGRETVRQYLDLVDQNAQAGTLATGKLNEYADPCMPAIARITWPIFVASTIRTIPNEQRQWLERTRVKLKRNVGYGGDIMGREWWKKVLP